MSIGILIRNDLRIQLRSGFYAAYAFVAVAYAVLLRALPADVRSLVLPPVLLSEAAVVGFFFAGALLHFERSDGTLAALAVTPVTVLDYILAKAASLAALNVLVALAVVIGAGPRASHVLPLVAGALLAALFFTLVGLATAARFRSVERFVVLGGLASAVFGLAALPYFGMLESALWALLPTTGYLGFIARAVESPSAPAGALIDTLVLAVWCGAALLLCMRWLERYAIGRQRVTV